MMMKQHTLTKVKIASLKFDKTNPNKLTEEQMSALHKSMEKFGYLTPIVIDQNNMIADGEHRALVYKQHGLEEIPAFKISLKTDADRRMLRQVMNKLRGEHDRELDANELVTIFQAGQLDQLTQLLAQDKEDLQRLMLRYHPGLDFVTAENEAEIDKLIDEELRRNVPDTKLGDLYQLGNHRLICADCTDERSIAKLMDGQQVSQLNTDPPYGVRYGEKNAMLNEWDGGHRVEDQYDNVAVNTDYREMFGHIFKVLPWAEHNTLYIWSGDQHLIELRAALDDAGLVLSQYLVWMKNNHVLGRKDYHPRHEFCLYGWHKHHRFFGGFRTSLLEYAKPSANDLHSTMKPTELIRQTITDGTQRDDNILDVFAGSGTTLIASEQTGRKCYGVELDPHYCDVIIKRWEMYTGKKAVKL